MIPQPGCFLDGACMLPASDNVMNFFIFRRIDWSISTLYSTKMSSIEKSFWALCIYGLKLALQRLLLQL